MPVAGTAAGPSPDRRVLDTTPDFAGGSEVNASTTGGRVNHTLPQNETYRYYQDFTGLTNASVIDNHWMSNFSLTSWSVTANASQSASPPSLAHFGVTSEHIYFDTLLPGAMFDGRLSFKYACEPNGTLVAFVSRDGFSGNETGILATAGVAQTQLDYNLTTLFAGAASFYVRFVSGAVTTVNSFCSVDDFELVATFNQTAFLNATFRDNFATGTNAVWNPHGGTWSVGPLPTVTDTPPSFSSNSSDTEARAQWGFASTVRSAVVSFHYQCEPNGSLMVDIGGDLPAPMSRILTGPVGAGHSSFFLNVTPFLNGSKTTRLLLWSYSVQNAGNRCGVDDVLINWTIAGNLNQTYNGLYTSPVVDLLYPSVLTGGDWVATVPAGTSLLVAVRSSMNNASFSAWYPLPSSGAAPSPTAARYVQFRLNFTSVGGLVAASVDRLGVNFSAIARVELSVNGGPWALATGTLAWNGTVPLAGGSNNITARVTDSTGATSTMVLQIFRDTFPPGAPGKPAGLLVTNSTDASWTWTAATDYGLGVDHYLVDVGLSPGGQELGGDIPVSGYAYTASGLPDNQRVYLSVRAVDLAGLTGPASAPSDGTLMDRTPPGPVSIQGPGAFTKESQLNWTWSPASDFGSGVGSYRVLLGTSAGASDAASTTSTSPAFSFTGALSGTSYYLTISAVDNAGNEGPSVMASGTTVDRTPPTGPASVTSPALITNASTLSWSWPSATDALSGIDYYDVLVGTSFGGSDIAHQTLTTTSYSVSFVPSGARYYFEVRAIDRAGNIGAAATGTPVLVDDTAPPAPPTSALPAFVGNATQLITWQAVSDLPATNASGIDHYLLRITSIGSGAPTTTDVLVPGTSATVNLADGEHYTIAVSAVDRAGNIGASSQVSFRADRSGPLAPTGLKVIVSDAAGPSFTASWNGTSDAGAGLREYRVRVGTAPGLFDVVDSSPTTKTSYQWTGKFATTYFVSVWGVDNLDNEGPANTSAQGISAQKPGAAGGGFLPGFESVAALAALATAFVAVAVRRRN